MDNDFDPTMDNEFDPTNDNEFDPTNDNEFDPAVFLKIGQLLCSEEYIYYGGLVFQEDIDRYNHDKEEEHKAKFKSLIIEGINEYNKKIETKNKIRKIILEGVYKRQNNSLITEINNLKKEITELTNKNIYLIKNNEINSYISEKYKIYEETIIKLIILKDELEQQLN